MIKKDLKFIQVPILFILTGIFFFVYSFLAFSTYDENLKLNSPDESANYYFAKSLAETGQISYFDADNKEVDNIIHPRSTKSIDGKVVPTSFLGIILLYGFVGMILGVWIIPFLTPLLASIGIIFFYYFLKNIFAEKVAFLSTILLIFCAPFWYYATKSMYHNVPFVVFVIIGLYFLSLQFKNELANRNIKLFTAGVFLGLALSFRLSEVFWFFIVFLIACIFYKKELKYRKVIIFVIGIFLPLAIIFIYNSILYNSSIANGYIDLNENVESNIFINLKNIILPFGLNLVILFNNFFNYFIIFFWFIALPSTLGIFVFTKKTRTKEQNFYLSSFMVIVVWLLIYYGSWEIKDNISLTDVTIGNSYVRYWLPIYIFSLPFASIFLWDMYHKKIAGKILFYAMIFIYLIFSANTVLISGEESILAVRKNILEYQSTAKNIISKTERDAIIMVRYEDKIFFPDRRVIVYIADDYSKFSKLNNIIDDIDIYYYNKFIGVDDVNFINNNKINEFGLIIENKGDGLYKVVKK